MTDKILKEAFDRLVAIEEAVSPEEEEINRLTLLMRRATEDDDEAAYKRAVTKLNALTDKMNAEQSLREDDDSDAKSEQVAAISQLIADRTEDENSPSKLSTEAFVGLINKMGLPMTQQTLMDLVEKGNLQSIIKDVNQDEVQFKGQQDVDPGAMSVDKAKDVVANMAKRAAKKGIKK